MANRNLVSIILLVGLFLLISTLYMGQNETQTKSATKQSKTIIDQLSTTVRKWTSSGYKEAVLHEAEHSAATQSSCLNCDKLQDSIDNLQKRVASLESRLLLGRQIRDCILRRMQTVDLWKKFVSVIRNCSEQYSTFNGATQMEEFHMGRYGEKKRFIIPETFRDQNTAGNLNDCKWLTIGIGGDTKVEREFHAKYANVCSIFGIEPSPDQYKKFKEFGTVIPLAVGLETGKTELTLRIKNKYEKKQMEVHPIHEVLDQYVGSRIIDFSTLDIEGYEYTILKGLFSDGVLTKKNVIFCQLDVELHNRKWMGAEFDFNDYIRQLLQNSPYVPIYAEGFGQHRKINLIYAQVGSVCDHKFGFSKFF